MLMVDECICSDTVMYSSFRGTDGMRELATTWVTKYQDMGGFRGNHHSSATWAQRLTE